LHFKRCGGELEKAKRLLKSNSAGNGKRWRGDHDMTVLDFLLLLLVAGVCGALGQAITGFSRGGCLVSIALGFIGALLGAALSRALALPELLVLDFGETKFPSCGRSLALRCSWP
jgi:uncharacterized membrane protein YeaQ/YmgE (transglycosylase-associated protein family)